jgi:type II secretory pathway component PulF
MPIFIYKAVNSSGKEIEGQIEGASKQEVQTLLLKKRLRVEKLQKKTH